MIGDYGAVVPPVIVRKEDLVLIDGYCRYRALKLKNVLKTYAYVGTL